MRFSVFGNWEDSCGTEAASESKEYINVTTMKENRELKIAAVVVIAVIIIVMITTTATINLKKIVLIK